jgi:hypothetical protein
MYSTHSRPVSEQSLELSGILAYIDDEIVTTLIMLRTERFQAGRLPFPRLMAIF